MNNVLEHKRALSKGGDRWGNKCSCCDKKFDYNQPKNTWRLNIPQSNRYLRGMFWTVQCDECMRKTKEEWTAGLEQIQV